MDDVVVLKAANHIHDGIGLADVGQELVTQAFALRGARHQASNVNKLHRGWQDALGRDNLCQLIQSGIGQLDNAGIGLDGAEGIVLSSDAGLGQRIKQGALAHIGQSNDSALK